MAAETTDTSTSPLHVERIMKSEDAQTYSAGKNLVVCIDGTANQFGRRKTNVIKLFNAIDLKATSTKQHAYYSSGIGTRSKSQSGLGRVIDSVADTIDMAVAWSVDKNIKEAYGWLAERYEEGDRIFLFGFSRGAYQVRVLAGMIHEVGLIRTPTKRQIVTAYDYYEAIRPGKLEVRQIAREFKDTFCWDNLTVHFIGVWDTVSSVGLTRRDVSLPMSSPARSFRHALALDERRVKFMPEYSRETDFSSVDDALDVQQVHTSGGNQSRDVKEVWFAGCHSDVGGQHMPGKAHHAGNISLLWMYREAVEHGLVLRPMDVTWGPEDIEFGTRNSMGTLWRIVECIAIKQQVSHHGPGKDALRAHWSEPRLIMPHQKVHASILYANAYKPVATRGRGFDISMMYETSEDTPLDDLLWETDLFGDIEAQELVDSLSRRRRGATECLDKLLFMLRFDEGKRRIRNVPDWHTTFLKIIRDSDYVPLIRLVAIVAYYEARDPKEHLPNSAQPDSSTLDCAKEWVKDILKGHGNQYNSRTVALLNILTRHEDLRKHILTEDILQSFVMLVDSTIVTAAKGKVPNFGQRENNFVQVMKGLNSLLQCKTTRRFIILKLWDKSTNSGPRRLSRVLEVNDPHFLIAALRMMLTLARVSKGPTKFSFVEPRICELARTRGGIIGPLAVEIWFALHNPTEQQPVFLDNTRVRANIASALVRTNFNIGSLVDKQNSGRDPGSQVLPFIFGTNVKQLDKPQKKLIRKLMKNVQNGNLRVRTNMTMVLLKLCETDFIRDYLCEINLVGIFVDQLRHKGSALLAAYALATCLKEHPDMKDSIETNALLPKHIVSMLRLDCFDDAIGQVEGLTIFVQLMQHSVLREGVMKHNLMKVLGRKAGKGQLKNILSGLLYKSESSTDPSIKALVEKSLELLGDPDWKTQKTGVTILTALAQTTDGAEVVKFHIPKVIELILPENYQHIQPSLPGLSPMLPTSVSEGPNQTAPAATTTEPAIRLASTVMGPACALRNLALNRMFSMLSGGTKEYRDLRDMYESRSLIAECETKPWHIYTPTRSDVTTMLGKMITAIEGELSEEDLMWIGDTLPPGVQHWGRAFKFLGYTAVGTALSPVALGAFVGLTALTLVALATFYLSVEMSNLVRRSRKHKARPGVDEDERLDPNDPDLVDDEDAPTVLRTSESRMEEKIWTVARGNGKEKAVNDSGDDSPASFE